MRNVWTAVLAAALAASSSTSAALADDLADLKAAHAQFARAIATRDVDGVLALSHDEQVRFERSAPLPTDYKTVGRAEARKQLSATFAAVESYTLTPVDVEYRVIGDTGIVWGHNVDIVKTKESPGMATLSRITAIYARSGGKWLRVCTHVSAVPTED